ncbi:hypothetical protein PM076_14890 [Halorubrum ezzemoulense]|uniref:hypothetical protein n=1 Tax=Halorubrum ezzemoulense TaxID=337243 RepID=UPI0023314652|nr:hypothetical protein [Halorubrum ezzemoulense]MDB2245243.1 hypothetical protein [Halorubrum ezzemoulense]MDB2290099.1 hypothetical protein [Halorubrum ezzemoulense]MDB2297569.1 hypothetical protein [Halorubrum ezzemoulense]MDB2301149.1 hypothetical protein [Halorubrum ezzemoulense]
MTDTSHVDGNLFRFIMSNDSGSTDEYEHLFVVEYEEDTERKRVEYLFNNWEEGNITRPDGIIRITSDVDYDDLYEQLLTKVPEEQITSYELARSEPTVDKQTKRIERTINAPMDTVESFLNYVFSKRKGVVQSAEHNEYEIVTKKGRADVRYTLSEDDGTTTTRIIIEGYEPTPSFLSEFFEKELDEFSASQQ